MNGESTLKAQRLTLQLAQHPTKGKKLKDKTIYAAREKGHAHQKKAEIYEMKV